MHEEQPGRVLCNRFAIGKEINGWSLSRYLPFMLIIGITGTLGAGKGTAVDFLVKEMGFKHYSVRSFLADEIRDRGLVVNRDSMVMVANDLRSANSPSYIIEKLYEQAAMNKGNCVIESIRTPGEISALRRKGNFVLLAIDAEQELRYNRIHKRKSETDQVSFDTFVSNEDREMHSDDPNRQNLAECIRQADHIICNDGSIADLNEQLSLFINSI